MDNFESVYQDWLAEYKALETQAPLTAQDALMLGGMVFEQRMREAVKAGVYNKEWIKAVGQFELKVMRGLEEFNSLLSYEQYNQLLGLQIDAQQINPDFVLMPPLPIARSTPDNIADALAEGRIMVEDLE